MSDINAELLALMKETRDQLRAGFDAEAVTKAVTEAVKARGGDERTQSRAAELVADEAKAAEAAEDKAAQDAEKGKRRYAEIVSRKAYNDDERELQRLHDRHILACKLVGAIRRHDGVTFEPERLETYRELEAKAMATTLTGFGKEFVGAMFSPQIIEALDIEQSIAGEFEQIPLVRSPMTWPVGSRPGFGYLLSEPTTDTGEKIPTVTAPTSNLTFTGKVIAARTLVSRHLEEDSVPDVIDYVERYIAETINRSLNSAILNGDTDASFDTVLAGLSPKDHRRSWDGLRKLATAPATDTTSDLATFSAATYNALKKKMGRWGVVPGNLRVILPLGAAAGVVGDNTNWPAFQSVDLYGPQALNVEGFVGRLYGAPVIQTELIPETLHTDGKDTGAGSKTAMVIANVRAFALAIQRQLEVETIYDPETQQFKVIGSIRADFKPWHPAATEKAVAVGYNMAL